MVDVSVGIKGRKALVSDTPLKVPTIYRYSVSSLYAAAIRDKINIISVVCGTLIVLLCWAFIAVRCTLVS